MLLVRPGSASVAKKMTQMRSKQQVILQPNVCVRVIEILYGTRCNLLINPEPVPYYSFPFQRKTIDTKYMHLLYALYYYTILYALQTIIKKFYPKNKNYGLTQ
jgi:hypothetical protein